MSMADIRTVNVSHVIALALVLSSVLLMVQCGALGVSSTKSHNDNEQPPELRELLHQGNNFFRSGQYLQAIQIYERGYKEAKRRGLLGRSFVEHVAIASQA